MKIGDFVVLNSTVFSMPGIVKILIVDPLIVRQISYAEYHKDYFKQADTVSEITALASWAVLNKSKVVPFSLEEFGKILINQPLIRPSEKANLAEFLKQKLIEQFGSPPTSQKVVEADVPPAKPLVIEGAVEGFIRINRQ